ncbi:hypothetical protein [Sodalis sp.]|uniref:hypothetical protein n=1 Tax=Sodalis sp. (in: enterobacteria) TaxID=1898979 RepID=UPI0038732C35
MTKCAIGVLARFGPFCATGDAGARAGRYTPAMRGNFAQQIIIGVGWVDEDVGYTMAQRVLAKR